MHEVAHSGVLIEEAKQLRAITMTYRQGKYVNLFVVGYLCSPMATFPLSGPMQCMSIFA